jgi:hypothetical protein
LEGTQALVAGARTAAAVGFDVLEELPDPLGGDIGDGQPIDRSAAVLGYEGQQLHEHVSVAFLRVHREITFADQMLEKEAANPGADQ